MNVLEWIYVSQNLKETEKEFEKEKFNAVLNLKNNTVKTSSKIYKKGNNTLNAILLIWSYRYGELSSDTLGHYLMDIVQVIGKDTTFKKTGDKITVDQIEDFGEMIVYSKAEVDKSKLIKLEVRESNDNIKIKLK